jgi:hypothetical protein
MRYPEMTLGLPVFAYNDLPEAASTMGPTPPVIGKLGNGERAPVLLLRA